MMRSIAMALMALAASAFPLSASAGDMLQYAATQVEVQTLGGVINKTISNSDANTTAGADTRGASILAIADAFNAPILVYTRVTGYGTAEALAQYFFEATGPIGTTTTIDMTAALVASVDFAMNTAGASLSIFSPCETGGDCALEYSDSICAGYACGLFQGAVISDALTLPTDTLEEVTIQSTIRNSYSTFASVAAADPYFSLDPSDGPGYALEFSPGVTNSPELAPLVPEPTTWSMLLLGVGLAGACIRRRQHRRGAGASRL